MSIQPSLEKLLSPLHFRSGGVAPNAIALAALTNLQSYEDGTASTDEQRWLARRARGGFGVIATCASHVSLDGRGFVGQMGCFDDSLLTGLRSVADGISAAGSLGLVQIFHAGVRAPAHLLEKTGHTPWTASEITERKANPQNPAEELITTTRAGTVSEIESTIENFVNAAKRAKQAGFAGVEIHGAHGYLLTQFLNAATNQRTDAWGGSLENRARLLLTITRRIREEIPAPFVVGVRVSPEDFGFVKGLDLDESLQVATWLDAAGVDFIHLSLWNARPNSQKYPDKHTLAQYRARVDASVKLFVAGQIWTADDAAFLVEQGADAVALGRAAIFHPDWPRDVVKNRQEPHRPPMTRAQLADLDVGPAFIDYLQNRWTGLVGG